MAGGLLRSTKALIEQLPAFGGGREGIALPFQFIFGGEDNLKLFVSNTVTGQVIRITGRWIESGTDEVQVFSQDYQHSGSPTEQTFRLNVGRGVLLNLAVLPTFNICQRGQCFVRVDIERGENARIVLGTLLQGYVDSSGGRAWPGSPLESAVEGPGLSRTYTTGVPAPASAVSIFAPAATRWRVVSATAALVTSPVAGNRRPFLVLGNNSTTFAVIHSSIVQPFNASIQHTFASGLVGAEGSDTTIGIGGVPQNCFLQTAGAPDAFIQISALGMDPADQWGSMQIFVEEWRNPITTP